MAAEGRPPLWRRPKAASFALALNKAHALALNTAHVLRLNKADVLALNKAHVWRLNNKICPGISVESSVISVSCKSFVSKTRSSRSAEVIVKTMRLAPTGKNTKSVFQNMCSSVESGLGGAGACTGAPRPSPSPQPAHNTKVSREVASSQVMRIAARSAFLELVAEVTAAAVATEVVSRSAARTPPSTRTGGQDDGSLNKLPQIMLY